MSQPSDSASQSSPSVATSSCMMIRYLQRDMHSLHSLIRLLTLVDLSVLYTVCRTWQQWILHPPTHLQAAFGFSKGMRSGRMHRMHAAKWPQLYVSSLSLAPLEMLNYSNAQQTLSDLLELLPDFSNLSCLQIQFIHGHIDPNVFLRTCTKMKQRLRSLHLIIMPLHGIGWDYGNDHTRNQNNVALDQENGLPVIIPCIEPLDRLETLTIECYQPKENGCESKVHIDFRPFSSLTSLRTFSFNFPGVLLSQPNVTILASLPKLEQLDMPLLIQDLVDVCDEYPTWEWAEKALKIRQAAETAAANKSTPSAQPHTLLDQFVAVRRSLAKDGSVVPLQSIGLHHAVMTPVIWSQVKHLTSLTALTPRAWSIPAESVSLTANFTALKHFHFDIRCKQVPLSERTRSQNQHHYSHLSKSVPSYWPHLLACTQLESLSLSHHRLDDSMLRKMVTAFTALTALRLHEMCIESLDALVQCAHLAKLELLETRDLNTSHLQVRPVIPSLPYLTALSIREEYYHRLTANQALAPNLSLTKRCPKLKASLFRQSLKKDHYY